MQGTHETRSFQLEKGKKDSPILVVSFTTDWVKINGKRLTKCAFICVISPSFA